MSTSRRTFLQTSALAATGAALAPAASAAARTAAPGDRVRMGFIGVGNRGTQLLETFLRQPDVELVAISDVYEPYATRKLSDVHPRWVASGRIPRDGKPLASSVGVHRDFRELLDRDDVDAVCIATPDHWHAIQTIQALEAGKDVYVEKPLSITLHEGRRMVEAQ
jgi:predicted dehydrogenase